MGVCAQFTFHLLQLKCNSCQCILFAFSVVAWATPSGRVQVQNTKHISKTLNGNLSVMVSKHKTANEKSCVFGALETVCENTFRNDRNDWCVINYFVQFITDRTSNMRKDEKKNMNASAYDAHIHTHSTNTICNTSPHPCVCFYSFCIKVVPTLIYLLLKCLIHYTTFLLNEIIFVEMQTSHRGTHTRRIKSCITGDYNISYTFECDFYLGSFAGALVSQGKHMVSHGYADIFISIVPVPTVDEWKIIKFTRTLLNFWTHIQLFIFSFSLYERNSEVFLFCVEWRWRKRSMDLETKKQVVLLIIFCTILHNGISILNIKQTKWKRECICCHLFEHKWKEKAETTQSCFFFEFLSMHFNWFSTLVCLPNGVSSSTTAFKTSCSQILFGTLFWHTNCAAVFSFFDNKLH